MRVKHCGAACLCALAALNASAQADSTIPGPQEETWWTVSDEQLANMRGGFDLGSGLFLSFGISRAVYINNELITSTSLQIDRLDQLTPAKVAELTQQLQNQTQVIQNGQGNHIESSVLTLPLATYIQNSLDNQVLRTETLIQASTNGMSVLREMNLQATIHDAIQQAIRQP